MRAVAHLKKVYRLLAQSNTDWSRWQIYYGDERCLPADHSDRNSVMANTTLLEQTTIPATQVFTMPTEQGNEAAAAAYRVIVANALPFDMVLLGMGEDGHTASLFPGHQHDLDELVHAVYNSPKPPPERISLSAKALSTSSHVLFLITGAGKQAKVAEWRAGADLPVAQINPANGIDIFIDQDAFSA
ncbi:6-phosphogluconolactonase [Methylocucumis oryzae]|uniref:6-phosphogluconolactonase n=1 Tax=Methylocucumis oryzae TaxID=1632867 RepID=UPI003F6C1AC8